MELVNSEVSDVFIDSRDLRIWMHRTYVLL